MTGFLSPMLAQPFKGWDKLKGHVFSQPKFNGIRCIATTSGLWSREGAPITACDHVRESLAGAFRASPGLALDGELYCHGFRDNLAATLSLVQQQRDWDGRARQLIEFRAFDAPSAEGQFSARLAALERVPLHGAACLAPTVRVTSAADLDAAYAGYLADGYEGQMIRTDAPYAVGGRSRALQKRKTFRDAEFPLVEVVEASGAWAGHAKAATFRLPDGRTFGAVVAGGRDALADLLANWRRYGSATVRFLSLTPDGVPVPAVAIAFHPTAGRRF